MSIPPMMRDTEAPVPPGVALLDLIIESFAEMADLDKEFVVDVIAGREPITSEVACLLAERFMMTEEFWLDLQRNYDGRKRHETGNSGTT